MGKKVTMTSTLLLLNLRNALFRLTFGSNISLEFEAKMKHKHMSLPSSVNKTTQVSRPYLTHAHVYDIQWFLNVLGHIYVEM